MILPEFFDVCDECGRPFEPDTTYPVVTAADDETMQIHSFCDDECLTAWQADPSAETLEDGDGETREDGNDEVLEDGDGEAEA